MGLTARDGVDGDCAEGDLREDAPRSSASTCAPGAPLTGDGRWDQIVRMARRILDDHAAGQPIDTEAVAELARAVLLYQAQLLGSFGRTVLRP
jgi:hypothetical protein